LKLTTCWTSSLFAKLLHDTGIEPERRGLVGRDCFLEGGMGRIQYVVRPFRKRDGGNLEGNRCLCLEPLVPNGTGRISWGTAIPPIWQFDVFHPLDVLLSKGSRDVYHLTQPIEASHPCDLFQNCKSEVFCRVAENGVSAYFWCTMRKIRTIGTRR
jgi:hypothetical protein